MDLNAIMRQFRTEFTGETYLMFDLLKPTLTISIVASIIISIIMYFINIHMMTKRLNLE